jgi:antitoxin (DNA-binding transcriptional repressor) of toxin-antitoxin stability system
MKEVTIAELRKDAKKYFDSVAGGGTVRVYRWGRHVADIVPAANANPSWKSPASPISVKGGSVIRELLKERKRQRA